MRNPSILTPFWPPARWGFAIRLFRPASGLLQNQKKSARLREGMRT